MSEPADNNPIGERASHALLRLAVDLFSNQSIPYKLSDQVYMHILAGVEATYGRESRKKVEALFVQRSASALKVLQLPEGDSFVCPKCSAVFHNHSDVQTSPERQE